MKYLQLVFCQLHQTTALFLWWSWTFPAGGLTSAEGCGPLLDQSVGLIERHVSSAWFFLSVGLGWWFGRGSVSLLICHQINGWICYQMECWVGIITLLSERGLAERQHFSVINPTRRIKSHGEELRKLTWREEPWVRTSSGSAPGWEIHHIR